MNSKKKIGFVVTVLMLLITFIKTASAEFPDDFSDVVWLETDVSGWSETATLDVSFSSDDYLNMVSSKANEWPVGQGFVSCCNANAWVFAQVDDIWYAKTFEWMRVGQTAKPAGVVNGSHAKAAPLDGFWHPKAGDNVGIMISGLVRLNHPQIARERTNIVMVEWPKTFSQLIGTNVGILDAPWLGDQPTDDDIYDPIVEPEFPEIGESNEACEIIICMQREAFEQPEVTKACVKAQKIFFEIVDRDLGVIDIDGTIQKRRRKLDQCEYADTELKVQIMTLYGAIIKPI